MFRPSVPWLLAFAVVGVVVACLPSDFLVGAANTDLTGQFVAWRAFAADQIRHGHFPLWNPYTYSGQPFFGGGQSALLYPPNIIFLLLPLTRALNFCVLAHVVLLGWGVSYWIRTRELAPAAALITGAVIASSGVVLPHLYAGHLSNICTMAWVPWAFAGIEIWSLHRRWSGLLLASLAISLQILAGQLQYVFFFGVAAGVYATVIALSTHKGRLRCFLGLVAVVAIGSALAAAQLLPLFAVASECVRNGKLDYSFAAVFSLPPENLFTSYLPGALGGAFDSHAPYWGRCYPWEMTLFVGVAGLTFAIIAAISPSHWRRSRSDLLVAVILIILALGRHLPIYRWLYDYVPGFGSFRGMSKFVFFSILFLGLAIAATIDDIVRGKKVLDRVAWVMLVIGAIHLFVGAFLWGRPDAFEPFFRWIRSAPENDVPVTLFSGVEFMRSAARNAGTSMLIAGGIFVAICVVGLITRTRPRWQRSVLGLLLLEAVVFAKSQVVGTNMDAAMPSELRHFVGEHPGDYRVLNMRRANNGFLLGAPDVWGNDPMVLRRYAEFMTVTQDGSVEQATQYVNFSKIPPVYRMLRLRYAFVPSEGGVVVKEVAAPLPHMLLVSSYRLERRSEVILKTVVAPGFDPRHEAVLESIPVPAPASGAMGSVQILSTSPDELEIVASASAPVLLVVTDLYSRYWRADAMSDSSQRKYEVLPADYILRAIPLSAGRHHIRLRYVLPSFATGIVISLVSFGLWIGAFFMLRCRSPKLPFAVTQRVD